MSAITKKSIVKTHEITLYSDNNIVLCPFIGTDELPKQQKGKLEYHFVLTRQEFINRKRKKISTEL